MINENFEIEYRKFARMIDEGEDPRKILQLITANVQKIDNVLSYALYLPSEKGNQQQAIFQSSENFSSEHGREQDPSIGNRSISRSTRSTINKVTSGNYNYFDITLGGTLLGTLIIVSDYPLPDNVCEYISLLCYHISIVFERIRSNGSIQQLLDRLQVLTELNQLIGKNVSLKKITRTLAREAAYRFGSDIALTLTLNDRGNMLHTSGAFGTIVNNIPQMMPSDVGIFGHVLKTGGHMSVQSLSAHVSHGINFADDIGLKALDICCLEVRGECLGAILLGYRKEETLQLKDSARFEEFCQAAAIAISNAKTQKQITEYTERLQEIVDSRTADLAIQSELAKEANIAKSQFLANMSHELRTPLTSIVGYCCLVRDGFFGPIDEQQVDALNAVTNSCEHLTNLIDDVLNIERIESGKEEYEPCNVNVLDLLQQVYQLLLQTAVNKGIQLQAIDITEDVLNSAIYSDPKHIHQILINLLSNAIKYTPQGGKVWVTGRMVNDKIKISIIDNGVGISQEKKNKLFDRFERGDDNYSKSQEGTGIGLSLTRQLVEVNGGTIGVESELGQGSEFWILMPCALTNETKANAHNVVRKTYRLDGIRALIVDDNLDCCEVLREVLVATGADITISHSVEECLSILKEVNPNIILTDLSMPSESGLTLIDSLQNRPDKFSNIPVVVISACAFPEDRKSALDAGASLFISKPFKPLDVVGSIEKIINGLTARG